MKKAQLPKNAESSPVADTSEFTAKVISKLPGSHLHVLEFGMITRRTVCPPAVNRRAALLYLKGGDL